MLIPILFSLLCRITISFNCWEALDDNHYLYVTFHYIDDD